MHPPTPPQETVAAGRGKQREGILVFRNLFDRTIETQLPPPCALFLSSSLSKKLRKHPSPSISALTTYHSAVIENALVSEIVYEERPTSIHSLKISITSYARLATDGAPWAKKEVYDHLQRTLLSAVTTRLTGLVRPNRLPWKIPTIDAKDLSDMEWAPSTAPGTAIPDADFIIANPAWLSLRGADSSPSAKQRRRHLSFPTLPHNRTDIQVNSVGAGIPRSVRDSTDAGLEHLHLGHVAQGAQNIHIAGQDHLQSTRMTAARTPRQRSRVHTGGESSRRARARSQSMRSSTSTPTIIGPDDAFGIVEAGRSRRESDPSLQHHGTTPRESVNPRHNCSTGAENQLRLLRLPRAVMANESPAQATSPLDSPQSVTPQDPDLRLRPYCASSLANGDRYRLSYDEADSSNSEEDHEELYSRTRKRRRGAASSQISATAETTQLEQQRETLIVVSCNLMSNLSRARYRASTEAPRLRSSPVPVTSFNSGLRVRRHDLLMATQLQTVQGESSNAAASRGNLPRNYGETALHSAARNELEKGWRSSWMSYLPPPLPLGTKSIFYLSEAFPRSFDPRKRSALLDVFRARAPYVPSCINLATGLPYGIQYHVCNPCPLRRQWPRRLPLKPKGRGWPSNSLPLEVFQIIAEYLPRRSLQNMRLVNHEFENKVSNTLFHTVVVPFRPEIYGMMIHNRKPRKSLVVDVKGKGKQSPKEPEKTLHDGMKTFQGWGPHIKKFAMAFEVEESTLEKPPIKGKFETHPTFWGKYKWPHPYYNRFEFCEGLEKKADEFRCMSAALSNLTGVTELALSIDSGLGWLNGSDLSDRAQLFRGKPGIFGKKQGTSNTYPEESQEIWDSIVKAASQSQRGPDIPNEHGLFEAIVEWQPNIFSQLPARPLFGEQWERQVLQSPSHQPLIFGGINVQPGTYRPPIVDSSKDSKPSVFSSAALVPNALTTSQQEWLLETEWAQRAFISSFCMALCDNSQTFRMVTTLNIARLSSKFLPLLQRTDIWLALDKLRTLTINVSADWRGIYKSETGAVGESSIKPSAAARRFYDVLRNYVSGLQKIKSLSIGYVGGGEHQSGIYGRNKHILPAPVADFSDPALLHSVTTITKSILSLRHVEDLTLTNCWFTPRMLTVFCMHAGLDNVKTLRLNSISLTSNSDNPAAMEELSTELGTSVLPQGPPRYGDRSVANFFSLRPDYVQDPSPSGWASTPQRIGSWGKVIDTVTPGANLDFVRYAYQYYDRPYFDSLKRPTPKKLESITFESCGYVCLTNFKEFHQTAVGAADVPVPSYLAPRASELRCVMMDAQEDKLLGQIVPSFPSEEKDVLETGFPMQFGWTDETKAAQCLEDGQPLGGSGRFSGKVQRLTFSDHD